MLTIWTVVRFLHVLGAALWVGGQLTVSLVVLPLARRSLDDERRATLLTAVGRRFGILTAAFFLPLQIGTGVALAWRKGVTWESLLLPGYGQIRVVCGQEGRSDTWFNIYLGPARYGYNGGRWARGQRPPEPVLAAIREHGVTAFGG